VVGVGIGIFSRQDHQIYHKIFELCGKIEFYKILLINITTRPQENLVVGVGIGIFFILTTRPQDSPREFQI
jgi:hypothetical protein